MGGTFLTSCTPARAVITVKKITRVMIMEMSRIKARAQAVSSRRRLRIDASHDDFDDDGNEDPNRQIPGRAASSVIRRVQWAISAGSFGPELQT